MNDYEDQEPVFLHEISSEERGGCSLQMLAQIDESLNFEQSLIKSDARAAAGSFWDEYPYILEGTDGPMVLADISEMKSLLSITWRWDYSRALEDKRISRRPKDFPPLPPSSFRYPKSEFIRLDEPVRTQVLGIEAAFSSLRKRSAEFSELRVAFAKYKARRERSITADAESISEDR